MKRKPLIGDKLKGGLNMIDIESYIISIKLKWVKSLISTQKANWKIIPSYMLQKLRKDFLIFHMNIDSIKSISSGLDEVSAFYKDIITFWV